jgi:cation:H+ antiporter
VSARKGYGDIAVGNIIGADILNILWIIGASAVVNPISLTHKQLHFMFPAMMIIVGTMLVCMRIGYKIGKPTGIILLTMYFIYLGLTIWLFY